MVGMLITVCNIHRRPENLDEMFEHLSKAKTCKSLLKKHLTKDTFEKLKDKKTSRGATLGDCIISGQNLLMTDLCIVVWYFSI